ncbi:MAG: reverse transcriptase domain-containing protein, partial [Desulfobulbaceae bacterium]|nr:reverse transcriptase domain-containing protein [Desulfobulbaceae bacterium]
MATSPIRYADDFICAFQNQKDAERFYKVLGKRMVKFGLALAEEKTRIIRFSRLHMEDKAMF